MKFQILSAVLPIFSQVARIGKTQYLRKTEKIEDHQAQFLFDLLNEHANTDFGKEHSFSTIRSLEDFRRQVPVRAYSDLEPYILRMSEGEAQVLVADVPIYFNITSGSTGKRKLIPVTKTSRQKVSKASITATGFLADASISNNLPLGTLLFPASVNAVGKTKSGVDFAPVSTSDFKLSNIFSRSVVSSPYEAHEVAHLQSRHYLCLLFALNDENLKIIAETFPVTTLRLCQYLEKYADDLIQDLRTGTLAQWLQISNEQRRTLAEKLEPNPKRAHTLERILQIHGRLTPRTVWPHLSFLVTARGGTSDFYFERFPSYFGDIPIFGGVYSSAEATYGVHRDFNTDGVLLALDSGFYEFIPEDQWDKTQPRTVFPWEVEVGKKYRIVITNYNGFYRYDVGDVVEIEGFFHKTPIFIFRNRYKGFITCVGEKTTEYHVTQVINALQKKHDITLVNFCISLSDEIPPRYIVNIELPSPGKLTDPTQFLAGFDHLLGEFHSFYRLKRKDQVLPPILRILESGSFERLQSHLIAKGAAETQIKMPKITDDRKLLTKFKVIQELSL